MKNKLLTFLLIFSTLIITGCDVDEDPLVGTWSFTGMEVLISETQAFDYNCPTFATDYNGNYYLYWVNNQCSGTLTPQEAGIQQETIIIKKDGSGTINTIYIDKPSELYPIIWSENGSQLSLSYNGSTITGDYSMIGSKILHFIQVSLNGGLTNTLIYTKQ